ncbi:SufS family cysteine desulfurase [Candidatus Micrarchaeota archaeon]|nr:SufS family cysteine desulfurase [Candidatus Micrarchaeota archaeon]
MFDVDKIRKDFPIFNNKVNGKDLIYLDSAATAQRPIQVIDSVTGFYKNKNANVARGLHTLAEEATISYEAVREKVQKFIAAPDQKEIIFTRNATEAANLVMRAWGEKFIKKGDKIVTTIMEHHSDFVPWQQLAYKKGAEFVVVDITEDGQISENEFEKKVKGAKFVAFSAASNVLGTITDSKKLCQIAHDQGAVCFIDGAQSVPSVKTNVKESNCDFLIFSGHKLMAPFGSGVLYGKTEFLEQMDPFLYGGDMIREVHAERNSVWNELPNKFESGTPDVGAVIGLGAAIDYLNKIGMDKITSYEHELSSYLLNALSGINGLRVLGPTEPKKRLSLAAFSMEKIHPHDVSALLDADGIAVRSGHHCTMPLHERLKVDASTRASFYIYNKKEEVDLLVQSLERAKKIFS